MSLQIEQCIGPHTQADGFSPGPTRIARQGAGVVTDAHARYCEAAARGQMFSLLLAATTTGVAAGQLTGAAAAASTQFALLNPANSGKNLVLVKFGMGVISGTPGAGPLFHGYLPTVSSITAASPGGTIRSNILGVVGSSVAIPWVSAGGSALTGGQAPVTFRVADFSATNTAQAIANGHVRAIEEIAGEIVVPPGSGWLPLWGAAGTSLLNGYSITWEEVPV
jgi:hypothetical protein